MSQLLSSGFSKEISCDIFFRRRIKEKAAERVVAFWRETPKYFVLFSRESAMVSCVSTTLARLSENKWVIMQKQLLISTIRDHATARRLFATLEESGHSPLLEKVTISFGTHKEVSAYRLFVAADLWRSAEEICKRALVFPEESELIRKQPLQHRGECQTRMTHALLSPPTSRN